MAKVERITWLDSNHHEGWHNPDVQDYGPLRCTSFGIAVSEGDDYVTLGRSWADSLDPQTANAITIPTGAIVSREVIDTMEPKP